MTFEYVNPVKKHQKTKIKVLLLLVIYLFFYVTNSFFRPHEVTLDKSHSTVKQATEYFVHLQKAAKIAISENKLSISRLIRIASLFFIVLLFSAGLAGCRCKLTSCQDKFYSCNNDIFLRYCVIRT
jgi:hypothetical protein